MTYLDATHQAMLVRMRAKAPKVWALYEELLSLPINGPTSDRKWSRESYEWWSYVLGEAANRGDEVPDLVETHVRKMFGIEKKEEV